MLNGVSEDLIGAIKSIMKNSLFDDFSLGGGTNLAIKYNHRLSIDIDLFSPKVLHFEELNKIIDYFKALYGEDIIVSKHNFGNEENPYLKLAWLQIELPQLNTKVDIIQNLQLLRDPEIIDGIRLIHDDDIGAMKLLAAANRGVQKDFYDLYLLTEKKPLSYYYDLLKERQEKFEKFKTIFDISKGKILADLNNNLTPLGNFNNAGNLKNESNRIVFTKDSTINIPWAIVKSNWFKRVEELAKNKNLKFEETKPLRKKRGFSF